MPSVPPQIAYHQFNLDPSVKLIKQKKSSFNSRKENNSYEGDRTIAPSRLYKADMLPEVIDQCSGDPKEEWKIEGLHQLPRLK